MRATCSCRIHACWSRCAAARAETIPKPDLVVCLDAPAEVLYARKAEGTLERVRRKREESLAAVSALPHCIVVDATRPPDEVVSEVATAVRALYERRLQERRARGRFFVRALRPGRGRRS